MEYGLIKKNIIFRNLTTEELEQSLTCSNAKTIEFQKNEIVFSQNDPPKYLFILLSGSVVVCSDSIDGKRNIIACIEESEMFGEVFLFLEDTSYPSYAITTKQSQILLIPKEFFFKTCANSCDSHSKIIHNMLNVMSQKAFYLSNKVSLLSCGSLREKILKYLSYQCGDKKYVTIKMNRDQLADYLNVARPSLSRELMKMQKERIIEVDKNTIKIINIPQL